MNGDSPWTMDQEGARLALGRPVGSVDFQRPELGLMLESGVVPGVAGPVQLLGVHFPVSTARPARAADRYVRGGDLAVVYEPQADWPVRVDILWRADPAASASAGLRFELILSASTQLLDSRPTVAVTSELPEGELLRWSGPEADTWAEVEPTDTGEAPLAPDGGTGCLVWRPAGSPWSYVEMVHPRDLHAGRTVRQRGCLAARRELFTPSLEKGVILRAWLIGQFAARADDLRIAADAYAAFVAAEPPLGT